MIWKRTWLLVGLTAGLLAFILFYEHRLGEEDPQAPPSSLLLPALESQAVTAVEFADTNGVVRVEKNREGWRMTSPVRYPANGVAIEAFLKVCSELTSHTTIPEHKIKTQPDGLADYGLDPAGAILMIHQRGGKVELKLGSLSPNALFFYAQVADQPTVEIVDAGVLESLPHSPDAWRHRSVLDFDTRDLTQVEVRAESGGFSFARDNPAANWQIVSPPPVKRADNFKVNQLLELLRQWQVSAFVTDQPSPDLEAYGLEPPKADLSLHSGTNFVTGLQLGGLPSDRQDMVFIRRLSHTNIVAAPNTVALLLQLSFDHFRDRQLLSFSRDKIDRIDIQGEDSFSLARGEEAEWRFVQATNLVADPDLVNRFLTNLAALQVVENGWIKEVVADYTPYGLNPPLREYRLLSTVKTDADHTTNQVVASLAIGNPYQADKILARRMDEASVYAIPRGDAGRLPSRSFELRDRGIWDFSVSNIASVTTHQYQTHRKLAINERGQWTIAEGVGSINVGGVVTTLFSIGHLRAETWLDQGTNHWKRYGFDKEAFRLEIEVAGDEGTNTHVLHLGYRAPSQNAYAATQVDGQTTIFEIARDLYNEILMYLALPPP